MQMMRKHEGSHGQNWGLTPTMLVFWKKTSTKENKIFCSWEQLLNLDFCWGLHWTSLRGCWIQLRLCTICFVHVIQEENECMNILVYAFCGYQALIPWHHWLWIVLTPWRWFVKLWLLLCRLEGFSRLTQQQK